MARYFFLVISSFVSVVLLFYFSRLLQINQVLLQDPQMFSKSMDLRTLSSVVIQIEAFEGDTYLATCFLKVEPLSHSIPQFSQDLCDSQSMSVFLGSDSGFWPVRRQFYYFFTLKIGFKLVEKSAPKKSSDLNITSG